MQLPSQQPTSLLQRAAEVLPRAEMLFTISTVIGTAFWLMKYDQRILSLSLACLAVIYFISAFRPLTIPFRENEPLSFLGLLALVIIPKVAWINCAVITMGILFNLIIPESPAFKQMLLIGSISIPLIIIILVMATLSKVPHLKVVTPLLYRAVPLLFIALYLMANP